MLVPVVKPVGLQVIEESVRVDTRPIVAVLETPLNLAVSVAV